MRLARKYKLDISIKIVYCALVPPILNYNCIVWDFYTANDSRQLERVQIRFLRFARFLLKIPYLPHKKKYSGKLFKPFYFDQT